MASDSDDGGDGKLQNRVKEGQQKPLREDYLRDPHGSIYSGPSKRVAITDGEFAPVSGIPPGAKNKGRLTPNAGEID